MVEPYWTDKEPDFALYCGDNRAVMPQLGAEFVDSIVTDPPYELGFMGKGWDRSGIAYDVDVWRECLRVLKPGGHLLAFGGSRTYHRLACAVEDAGFEIRDQIQWIYGSGFPKSLDISKQIDSRGGVAVGWFGPWLRSERERRGIAQKSLAEHFRSKTGGLTGCVANWELGLNIPTPEQFNTLCAVMDLPFARLEEAEREVLAHVDAGRLAVSPGQGLDRSATRLAITAPATDAAKQWNGWGTALKPAHEPIVLARKPLIGTVAENVIKHGTGGLNIDGCRIETAETLNAGSRRLGDGIKYGLCEPTTEYEQNANGRWPANVIHDGSEEVLAGFPYSESQSGGNRGASQIWGNASGNQARNGFDDSGSAARFFYIPKADKSDRGEGLDDLPLRTAGEVTDRQDGSDGLNSPRAGAGRTSGSRNHHPTVKPTDLMRYLCRLITPPKGLVLDPFCGSGSTGKAARAEGFRFIGIEINEEYCALARARCEIPQRSLWGE